MNKCKRFLALLLVLCLTFSVVPLSAFAAEGDPTGEATETLNGDGEPAAETTEAVVETTTEDAEAATEATEASELDEEENGIDAFSEAEIEAQAITMGTKPADGTTSGQPFASGTGGSKYFRIPALVTLSDGSLVAAADARWNHTSDGYGLDTIVSRSTDNGATWSYTFANYLGDNGNAYSASSTAFIDPALAVDSNDTIYMLVDLYPTGGYIGNIKSGTGFDSNGNLLLSNNNGNSYGYYLSGNTIYSSSGDAVSGYTVDEYFNITGNGCDTNLFFSDSPYKVLVTSYLYLTKSTDGGATWSAPMMLNSQVKNSADKFYGVGPGGGIVTSTGRIIFPCYTYTTQDGNTSVIYSDDGGNTWTRSADMNVQTSEASISEVTVNGQNYLYMFTRHGGYFVSSDNGTTWSNQKSVGVSYTTSCELSTLTYSKTIDGCPAILLSAPTSSRTTGKIFVGLVQEDTSIVWKYTYGVNGSGTYAYSDLAELSDGSIGLLYENGSGMITYTNLDITTIAGGAQIGSAEKAILRDESTGVAVNFGFNNVESMTVKSATVDALEGKNYVAYDVTPDGYTGSAEVTIPLTEELNGATKLTGFVVEDGSITRITGTRDGDSYTFTAPHFSVMGVLASDGEVETMDVTLYVGQSTTITDSTGNHGTATVLDDTVAKVTTEGTTVVGGTTKVLGSTVSMDSDGTYTGVISDGNGNYLVLNGTTISNTTDINQATEWTVTRSNYGYAYTIKSGSYYLSHSTSNRLTASTSTSSWYYSNGFYYGILNTYYLRTNNGTWQLSTTSSNKGQLYSVTTSTTEPVNATTITITGKAAGTTSVTVGNTQYNITVKEAPEYVDSSNTPFTNTDYYSNTSTKETVKVTKLTTSVGTTCDLDVSPTGGTWSSGNTNIATVDQNGNVTGVSVGETTVTYTTSDGVSYTIPVVVVQSDGSNTCKIYVAEITATTVKYSFNVSTDLHDCQEGELIYVGLAPNFAINFFGREDEGYALTYMSSTNSAGNYYALYETDDITSLEAYTKGALLYQRTAFSEAAVQALLQSTIAAGYHGTMGWTRTNTSDINSSLTFRSRKLPTVEKTIKTVNGVAYTEGMTAKAGDVIVYDVTVTQYATTEAITYTGVTLKDNLSGATFSTNNSDTVSPALSNSALTANKTYSYTVTYTITDADLDKDIINTVDLSYSYSGQYSSGKYGGSAKAEAKISAPTFTPDDIVIDFGLPVTIDYGDNHGRYDIDRGTATYGTVSVANNVVTYTPNKILQGVDEVTLTNTANGTVTFKVYPATTVHYEETFIDFGNGTSGVTGRNQQLQKKAGAGNNFGYDSSNEGFNGASGNTEHTLNLAGQTGTFTFTGTGVEVYANCDANTSWVSVEIRDGAGTKVYLVNTVVKAGETGATNGQTGSFYSLPIVSVQGLTSGTYTVTIRKIVDNNDVKIDGIRIFDTVASSNFVDEGEAYPSFVELRDMVLTGCNVVDKVENSQYQASLAASIVSQVYENTGSLTGAVVISNSSAYADNESLKDLLDNGPKNELYLWPGQTVTFTLASGVTAQIGMKTVKGNKVAYSCNINGVEKNGSINSSTDMFYHSGASGAITITNNSETDPLSITLLKYFGAASAETAFAEISEEQVVYALRSLGLSPADTDPVTPVEPPVDPEVPVEPEITYADATLTVGLVDYTGKEVASAVLTKNGVAGEATAFTAQEILAAVAEQMPEKYALVDESAVTDVDGAYGVGRATTVQVGKVATLKITYVNLFGRKIGTVTITRVQTSAGTCQISASEIRGSAPKGRAVWLTPVRVPFGSEMSIIVSSF